MEGIRQANVRFGSLADMAARPHDVGFTPESGHRAGVRLCVNALAR